MKRGENKNTPSNGRCVLGRLFRTIICISLTATSPWTETAYAQQRQAPDAFAQQHIRALIESLPAGSDLRRFMEQGARGDGIHYPWMDKMQKEGVKRAFVRTEFMWKGKPTDVKVTRIVYFSNYDTNCGQISNPEQISKIRASGLEGELGEAAVQRTLRAHWHFFEHGHRTKVGAAAIELFDNEWLPPFPDSLVPMPKTSDPFGDAVGAQDVATAKSLLRSDVSPRVRDQELWLAIQIDNSCMIKAFLDAGADPKAKDDEGHTLLMASAHFGAINNAKALLAGGADINAKDPQGETALSIAERLKNQQMIQLLKAAGARE